MREFKLPDLGEGLQEAEIVSWHVAVGDTVALDQPIVSMETAKAVVEVPSPVGGKIRKLHGKPGDIIEIGSVLVEFEQQGVAGAGAEPVSERPDTGTVAGKVEVGDVVLEERIVTRTQAATGPHPLKATPAVRALAQRLNVDLSTVVPTGANGLLTLQDVQQAAGHGSDTPRFNTPQAAATTHNLPAPFKGEPLKGVRRAMAHTMAQAHAQVVPVTLCEDAHLSLEKPQQDITVNLILSLIKACQVEPALNAWFDGAQNARQLLSEVHLGIAMDSHEGLFVPVMKNAERLSRDEIRNTLNQFKQQVADRSIKPEQMHGASITLSNFGKFTGRYASPIVVPPMVAILGCGQLRPEPMVQDGQIVVAQVLPLSLTIDHRVVTGGEAARFLKTLIQTLEGF